MSAGFVLRCPPDFDFAATAFSHGWYMLPPYAWDEGRGLLTYVYQTASGRVTRLELSACKSGLAVALPDIQRLDADLQSEIAAVVACMLNLQLDLAPFYAAMRGFAGRGWIADEKRGRMLRGGSLWEDLAKVLLTTNTRWAQTKAMCRRLCALGDPHPTRSDCHAFPKPERIASMDAAELSAGLRAGYRSLYLRELAIKAAGGEIRLESWPGLGSDDVFRAVKSLRGFGDYAAGAVALLLGHGDRLAIDSACREMHARRHNAGVKGGDAAIRAHYDRYGSWRGLVAWLDVMRGSQG